MWLRPDLGIDDAVQDEERLATRIHDLAVTRFRWSSTLFTICNNNVLTSAMVVFHSSLPYRTSGSLRAGRSEHGALTGPSTPNWAESSDRSVPCFCLSTRREQQSRGCKIPRLRMGLCRGIRLPIRTLRSRESSFSTVRNRWTTLCARYRETPG